MLSILETTNVSLLSISDFYLQPPNAWALPPPRKVSVIAILYLWQKLILDRLHVLSLLCNIHSLHSTVTTQQWHVTRQVKTMDCDAHFLSLQPADSNCFKRLPRSLFSHKCLTTSTIFSSEENISFLYSCSVSVFTIYSIPGIWDACHEMYRLQYWLQSPLNLSGGIGPTQAPFSSAANIPELFSRHPLQSLSLPLKWLRLRRLPSTQPQEVL